ncbi:SGNH/GDSL hydrolase family protein [Actinoplanes teichomyceticus]|uniref:Lysophospholipase L1-like esterase n=1 Tax=Actinoplanes teichomyceticus TaxID=1867 RepID=A0A561WJZ3_ACTTI|nr:SGNH/GDSL hydrolase family protein [Actinoplanes teichomyceticus]TWG24191.1 lysophospholipase L1-like esterase [Actinoplanes teichomyceticus]GIF12962.1 SGNH hydrolase [Actinoplanes teichomyceticus]
MKRRALLAGSAGVVGAGLVASPAPATAPRSSWVHTWTAMPQLTEPGNMPPAPFTGNDAVLVDTTIRQTVHLSIGGPRLRVRFSNAFGTTDLPLTAAAVALPRNGAAGTGAIVPGSSRPLTFGGQPSVVVPAGAQIVSDPVPMTVAPRSNLTVSAYLADGQAGLNLTSHPGSRTTSWLIRGDRHADAEVAGTPVDHWYLLSGVEVTATGAAGLVILGDSLTDGRGSTTNGNDRWPDQLAARLRDPRLAVLNQAAGGNRVLHDGLGPNVLARFDRDVLGVSGAAWVLVFEGVNDIGTAEATEAGQRQVIAALTGAYRQIVQRAHAQDLRVYGATITPFGGHTGYDDPGGLRERARIAVNGVIRGGVFDGYLDFAAAVADPAAPARLAPAFDVGDHLHLNPAGYAALARAVARTLF